MLEELALSHITNESDMEEFWRLRDKYMNDDIIPDCDPPMSDDERAWSFSSEYKEHMMKLFGRETDTLCAAFLMKDGCYAGFVEYVIYNSEDGKCFIVEFCVEKEYRGMGLGKRFFIKLEDEVKHKQAAYFALNASNKRNRKFWESLGFVKGEEDEYGNPVYTRSIYYTV